VRKRSAVRRPGNAQEGSRRLGKKGRYGGGELKNEWGWPRVLGFGEVKVVAGQQQCRSPNKSASDRSGKKEIGKKSLNNNKKREEGVRVGYESED